MSKRHVLTLQCGSHHLLQRERMTIKTVTSRKGILRDGFFADCLASGWYTGLGLNGMAATHDIHPTTRRMRTQMFRFCIHRLCLTHLP
jgi:hypothetical protein